MSEKERYAIIRTWVEVFREEGVKVGHSRIQVGLKRAGIVGETARNRIGRVVKQGYYAESDVRGLIAESFIALPVADENNTLELNGQIYMPFHGLCKSLGVSDRMILSRIRQKPVQVLPARTKNGVTVDFYPVADVKKLFIDSMQELPHAGEDGTFELDGKKYATIQVFSELFSISRYAIQLRMKKMPPNFVRGMTSGGVVANFISFSFFRELCADLLEDLPRANADGTFELDGEIYGMLSALASLMGVADSTVRGRVSRSSLRSIPGKSVNGIMFSFYSFSDVRKLCSNLLQELSQADEGGTFELSGEVYGTRVSLSKLLGVSVQVIGARIKSVSLQSIQGKTKGGLICDFFPLSEVRQIFGEHLEKLPRADDDRLIRKDGETYGTQYSLAELLGLNHRTLNLRIISSSLKPIRGKDKRGGVSDFYSVTEVRGICVDFLEPLPRADKSGFFALRGVLYGSADRIAGLFGRSHKFVTKHIRENRIPSMRGRNSQGRECLFYPVEELRELCSKLPKKESND